MLNCGVINREEHCVNQGKGDTPFWYGRKPDCGKSKAFGNKCVFSGGTFDPVCAGSPDGEKMQACR